jgi:hypothetical protein
MLKANRTPSRRITSHVQGSLLGKGSIMSVTVLAKGNTPCRFAQQGNEEPANLNSNMASFYPGPNHPPLATTDLHKNYNQAKCHQVAYL